MPIRIRKGGFWLRNQSSDNICYVALGGGVLWRGSIVLPWLPCRRAGVTAAPAKQICSAGWQDIDLRSPAVGAGAGRVAGMMADRGANRLGGAS